MEEDTAEKSNPNEEAGHLGSPCLLSRKTSCWWARRVRKRNSKALAELGHTVEVFGGPPYPDLDPKVPLHEFPSLEIYNDYFP